MVTCFQPSTKLFNFVTKEFRTLSPYFPDLSLFDLVLIDLSIDNYNGLGHVEQIKQIYGPEEVAVIAYSVRMSPESIIRALNAGADDYLTNRSPSVS